MDIGLEIKLLREQKGMSGKDFAEKLGLSQSQVSRLEKGQRRINTETLHKIADTLGVSPSAFFREKDEDRYELNMRYLWRDMGKIIRTERHRVHMSPEEFAKKVGKTKGFVQGLEEGRYELDEKLASRVTRALKLDHYFFLKVYQQLIGSLTRRMKRLEKAHADVTLGSLEGVEGGRGIPVMGGLSGEYPTQFTSDGLPVDTIHEYVFVTGLDPDRCFALYVRGDSMESGSSPSFKDGDILLLKQKEGVQNHEYAFVRAETTKPVFRQVFFERDGRVRLQPLNLRHPPLICKREEVIRMWPLAVHIRRF